MFEVWVKATNKITKEVIYEGLKKTYENYEDAMKDFYCALNKPYNVTSWRFLKYEDWARPDGPTCYISCVHGNCRITVYIKKH